VDRYALHSCLAVKHRSTSKIADEAVILATILGLDNVEEINNVRDVDSRMAVWLAMMLEIPSTIIFGDLK
jgi:hypothetical protein